MMSKHVLPSTLFAILFLFLAASKVYAVPTTLSFQTKIYKPDGSPLEASAVNFRFTTVDSTGTCILYVEDFSNINMSTSAGMAIFNLGAGLRVFPAAAYIYTDIYNNLQSSFPCQGGGTFSPAPAGTDRRKIIAQFIDSTPAGWQTLPAIDVNSVPFSNFAGDSKKLAGFLAADFLRFATLPVCVGADVLTFNGTAIVCAASGAAAAADTTTSSKGIVQIGTGLNVAAGVASVAYGITASTAAAGNDSRLVNAILNTGAGAGNMVTSMQSGNTAGRPAFGTDGRIYFDTQAQIIYRDSGTAWVAIASNAGAGGTVTSITAGTGLTGGAITTSGTIGLGTELTGVNALATLGFVKRTAAGTYSTPAISLTADVSGTLAIANGGTGATTAAAALNNLLPTQATNANKYLQTDGTNAAWVAGNAGTVTSVSSANTDIAVSMASPTPVLTVNSGTAASQLVKLNASAQIPAVDGSLLTGFTAAQIPNLDTAKLTSGTLPVTRGGTGNSVYAVGDIIFASTTTALSPLAASTTGFVLTTNGVGTAPSWQAVPSTGTVSSGTINKMAFYAATGTTVSSNANVTMAAGNMTLGQAGSVLGSLSVSGNTSGVVSINPQAAAGTYNFNLPTTAGTAGQVLASGGGVAAPMTWTTLAASATTDTTNATNITSGVLAIARGGTNNTTLPVTAGGVIYTDGTKLMNVGAGTAGQVLSSNAAAAPTWINAPGDATKLPLAGGTMTGALVNNTNSASSALAVTQAGAGYAATFTGGNVGIGTTAPLASLQVERSTIDANFAATIIGNNSNNHGLSVSLPNATQGTGRIPFRVITQATTRFQIDDAGNVGIGTTVPGRTLEVAGIISSKQATVEAALHGNSGLGRGIAGTISNHSFSLLTNNIERVTVDTSGNVGIGTTTPAAQLNLGGNVTAAAWGSGIAFKINPASYTDTTSTGTVGTNYVNFIGAPTLTAASPTTYTNAATLVVNDAPTASTNVTNTYPHALLVNAGQSTFLGNTSVGIPLSFAKLTVYGFGGASANEGLYQLAAAPAVGSGTSYIGVRGSPSIIMTSGAQTGAIVGIYASPAANVAAGLTVSEITGVSTLSSHNGITTGTLTNLTGVKGQVINSSSGVTTNARALWAAPPVNSGSGSITNAYGLYVDNITAGTNRWSIYSNGGDSYFAGNVGIGTPAPGAALDVAATGINSAIIIPRDTTANRPTTLVNGMIRYNTTTALFEFYQNGVWANYTTVSDGRLKTNVLPIEQGLSLINQLRPVYFDWDQSNPRAQGFGDKPQVGFIAQELEKVIPQVVEKGEDSYRSVEYGKLVSVVVAAVQELYKKVMGITAEVENLRSENDKLKQENAAIKTRLQKIEKALDLK